MESAKLFNSEAAKAVKDSNRQAIFDDNIINYEKSVSNALTQYQNLALARKRAGSIRHKAINSLEKYLIEFEANFEKNGGKLIWALTDEQALNEVAGIIEKHHPKKIFSSGSLIADEISLDEYLEKQNIAAVKIDPDDWVLQQFGEKPRHPSSFLIEKSIDQITDKINVNNNAKLKRHVSDIVSYIKEHTLKHAGEVQLAITSANFLVADAGAISISENAGSASILNAISGVTVILAGIDKIIPSLGNLDNLISLYSSFSSGDRINAYNTIICGPKKEHELNGPSDVYLVLVDNGRSDVLAQKHQRRALGCIDCGACHNACPVYRKIGGNTYNSTYTGPIGSIINPWMYDSEEYGHQSYASTVCGRCTEVCPVGINLHQQLLNNRYDSIRMKNYTSAEKLTMDGWHKILKSRSWMDWSNATWKNRILKSIYGIRWGANRLMPKISDKSFRQLWEERREGKIK